MTNKLCHACGKGVDISSLTTIHNINICFQCSDLANEITTYKRNEIAEKEIKAMASEMIKILCCSDMSIARNYANRIYKAGYRKVE
ncbi:hypothetical protein AB7W14_21540 [Providencia rettgeri]|uniref:hypothetical protein n=1 Tax=Providencia hangzhouensis TaxID=3031799 RepID=UPI0024ABDEB0